MDFKLQVVAAVEKDDMSYRLQASAENLWYPGSLWMRKHRAGLKKILLSWSWHRLKICGAGDETFKFGFDERGIILEYNDFFDCLRKRRLLVKSGKSWTEITNSKDWMRNYPNMLEGLKTERSEQVFVSDISYVETEDGVDSLFD